MPVAGGPKITKTGILLEVDAADKLSYPGTGTTWINPVTPGTYNGTLNNISFDSNDSKGALIFTGSNTYVDFSNVGNLSSAWSFQVAFKPAATASGEPYTVLSYASGSDTGSITFKLDYSSSTQEVVLSTFSTASATARTVHVISGSALTGSWNIVHGTFGSQLAALFVNGLNASAINTTGSTVGYNTGNRLYAGLNFGSTTGYYSGSIANITVNNADLNFQVVNKNYNAIATRFGLPVRSTIVTDIDALNFLAAAGIDTIPQQTAIDTLVVGLKANNLWDKMVVIYPFIGGSATSHKYNLKDPRDTNDAYRLLFSGGWTHNNNGILGNGGNTTANTFLAENTLNLYSGHLSIYNRTNTVADGADLVGGNSSIRLRPAYSQFQSDIFQAGNISLSGTTETSNGYFIRSLVNSNSSIMKRYRAGTTLTGTLTNAPGGQTSTTFKIGTTLRNYSFVTIGSGLTSDKMDNLNILVQAYQTTLGRQV
jgi:hypothetical protein